MKVLAFCALALSVATAVRIDALKRKMNQETLAQLGAIGPFKYHDSHFAAKIGKDETIVTLSKERQQGAWNLIEGNSLVEAWAVSENGILLKQKAGPVACRSVGGLDGGKSVAISYSCMLEGTAAVHKPSWPIKTGYDAASDQENPAAVPFDDKDTNDFDPRIRFWHRCANGAENGLSLCNRHRYIGADAMGYYGCDYLTEDGYCVQSFRHDWLEFNPDDLAFILNPESPCAQPPCEPHADHIPTKAEASKD